MLCLMQVGFVYFGLSVSSTDLRNMWQVCGGVNLCSLG